MKKIGRNDPCPCGSGRKYKKCCLPGPMGGVGFTEEERASVLDKCNKFVDQSEWRAVERDAEEVFWGPYLEACEDLEDRELCMMAEDVFDYWFFFDYRPDGGPLFAERIMESGLQLGEGERLYLRQAMRTSMRLYEVVDIKPGESMRFRDLLDGHEVTVSERLGSRHFHRWDLLAARVMPVGKSGRPEMDGGCLPLPRLARESLLSHLRKELDDFHGNSQDKDDFEFYKLLAPFFCQAWIGPVFDPQMPKWITTDGEELLFAKGYFDVLDAKKLTTALDSAKDLEREEDDGCWRWHGPGKRKNEVIVLGLFRLEGGRLILETTSAERAEKGRILVERLAGDFVRYRLTSRQVPAQAMTDIGDSVSGLPEILPDEMLQAVSEQYERYYRGWLDEEIPALDERTPRQAAGSASLRPRLVEMLKDLENMYQKSLSSGQPGFDPSWMWAELGLSDQPDAPCDCDHPLITGYESMERQVPGIGDVARTLAGRFRKKAGFDASSVISREELSKDPDFDKFIHSQASEFLRGSGDQEKATGHADLLGIHLEYMCNFELHRRKTFWVDDSLAWMLGKTRLDITGDMLRPPFACFALVFCDRYTLRLAERMLSVEKDCELRGQVLKTATAYVTEVAVGADMGLRVAFTFDALAGQWPYLVGRDLRVRPEERLDEILESHFPDVDEKALDSIFSSSPLRDLLHLVINAILFATSAGVEFELRPSPKKPRRSKGKSLPAQSRTSADDVFYLPGKIDIKGLRKMQEVERSPGGGTLMHRFMVRGHWRRASASWNDQRPRWIRPYWKGPEIAAVIERAYRLKP